MFNHKNSSIMIKTEKVSSQRSLKFVRSFKVTCKCSKQKNISLKVNSVLSGIQDYIIHNNQKLYIVLLDYRNAINFTDRILFLFRRKIFLTCHEQS